MNNCKPGFGIELTVSLLFAFVIWASPAYALTINQDVVWGSTQVLYAEPLGQSFLATDTDIGYVGLRINPYYQQGIGDLTLTMSIFSGDGDFTDTAELTSDDFTLDEGFDGWLDLDVSEVLFTEGDMYTIGIFNDTTQWGVSCSWTNNVYADGGAFMNNVSWYRAEETDLTFHVGPGNNAAPVPEPASMLLLSTGLFGLAGFRKKFKK